MIIKNDAVNGIVTESDTTDIISEKFDIYFFHVPEAGKYCVKKSGDRENIDDGCEYWSARELAVALDYTKWENFTKVITKAMISCENSGHSVIDDFPEVRKIVEAGATVKPKKDYELSRYACYLIVQNGDPRKENT